MEAREKGAGRKGKRRRQKEVESMNGKREREGNRKWRMALDSCRIGKNTSNNFYLYSPKKIEPSLTANINYIIPKHNYNVLSGITRFLREVQH